ncbi:MAG: hypothetical protein IT440_13090 [Phycisphaeraceae bacterium]|nr:hypothetical protein [Phycisphaeraceae bacterium]
MKRCFALIVAGTMLAATAPKPEAVVDDVTVESPPEGAVNLLPRGDLEQSREDEESPAGWQRVDGLVYRWRRDAQHGRYIHIDTDVAQRQAYEWWIRRFVRGEALSAAPVKTPTTPPKYDTIAGLDGGFYWSDYMPVKPGGAYKVYVDARGPKAKVFIRGYDKILPLSFADETPAVQQVFRRAKGEPETDAKGKPVRYRRRYAYQSWFAVGGSDEWKTYTHVMPRHPNGREITENVRYIRITLYPYWPPGEYDFDNIRVVEVKDDDPRRGKPEAEEADLEEGKVVR